MALGDLELDCYVLADGRRVFHKRGMAKALGLKSAGGNAFMKTISRKGIGSNISPELREKILNPINFKPLTQDLAHGYEADILAEVAKAILEWAATVIFVVAWILWLWGDRMPLPMTGEQITTTATTLFIVGILLCLWNAATN